MGSDFDVLTLSRSLSLAIQEQVGGLTEIFEKHSTGSTPRTSAPTGGCSRSSTDQTRQDIKAWLAAPDPFTNHVANRKKRQAHTGTWLLRSKQYEHWLTNPKSFLWLYGIRMSCPLVFGSRLTISSW